MTKFFIVVCAFFGAAVIANFFNLGQKVFGQVMGITITGAFLVGCMAVVLAMGLKSK